MSGAGGRANALEEETLRRLGFHRQVYDRDAITAAIKEGSGGAGPS
jgi:hypothetical protein